MEKILKVQMAAELENQGLARAVAAAYASELDPTVEELTEIKTAVSEAFSNAAIHGYPDGSYGNVSMEFGTIKPDTTLIIFITAIAPVQIQTHTGKSITGSSFIRHTAAKEKSAIVSSLEPNSLTVSVILAAAPSSMSVTPAEI